MTKEEISIFSRRITQSSKSELVVVTYDIIIHYVETARQLYQDENIQDFSFNLKKAQQFLHELSSALDFQYKISCDLMSIYMYIERCLVESRVKQKDCKLDVVIRLLEKLRSSFEELSKQDDSGALMKNGEQIYVGLTYGKGVLNEVSVRNHEYN